MCIHIVQAPVKEASHCLSNGNQAFVASDLLILLRVHHSDPFGSHSQPLHKQLKSDSYSYADASMLAEIDSRVIYGPAGSLPLR